MNRDEIRNYIIQMYETLKKWLFQFIDWRERRIVRFYGLPKWKKTANTILTFFCLFLFYLLIVDINFSNGGKYLLPHKHIWINNEYVIKESDLDSF